MNLCRTPSPPLSLKVMSGAPGQPALYCIVLYCIVLYCIVLYLNCIVLYCYVLYSFCTLIIVLYCIVIYLQISIARNYILFTISVSGIFLKYSLTFANFQPRYCYEMYFY